MTALCTAQASLFDAADALPPGFTYAADFISRDQERELLRVAAAMPLQEARYREYTARRRVHVLGAPASAVASGAVEHADCPAAAGASAGVETGAPLCSPDGADELALQKATAAHLPPPLHALRLRLAGWAGVASAEFVHVMVAEYRRGVPLGWHRDAPGWELIAGVSLGGPARLRLRPWQPDAPRHDADATIAIELVPRSAYLMRGPARWAWQHSVPPVPGLRYSVTMRTARSRAGTGTGTGTGTTGTALR